MNVVGCWGEEDLCFMLFRFSIAADDPGFSRVLKRVRHDTLGPALYYVVGGLGTPSVGRQTLDFSNGSMPNCTHFTSTALALVGHEFAAWRFATTPLSKVWGETLPVRKRLVVNCTDGCVFLWSIRRNAQNPLMHFENSEPL